MSQSNPATHNHRVFIFSDIVDSTENWEANTPAMYDALMRHNEIFRAQLPRFGGHEVKAIGDGFFLSFSSPLKGLQFCLTIFRLFKKEHWSEAIFDFRQHKDLANGCMRRGSSSARRGLVLRMGINYGVPYGMEVHPRSGNIDYYGPVINKASRIEGKASTDEVVVSDTFLSALYKQLTGVQLPNEFLDDTLRKKILSSQVPAEHFDIRIKGEKKLKGIEQLEYITAVRLRR